MRVPQATPECCPTTPPHQSQEVTDMAITVYSKPNCVQCSATYRALDKAGLVYRTVDVALDVEAFAGQDTEHE